MILNIYEAFYISGECIPIIEIECNDTIFDNYYVCKNRYGNYLLNFKYGIFDSINNCNDIIKNIIEEINQNYLDKYYWKDYLYKKNISFKNEIRKEVFYNKVLKYNNENKLESIDNKNYDDNYKPKIKFIENDKLNNIFDEIDMLLSKNIYKVIRYEMSFNNKEELLYGFLTAIFSSVFKYNIIMCENCGKYFVDMKSDIKYCDRIYKVGRTCKKIMHERIKKVCDISEINNLADDVYEKAKKYDLQDYNKRHIEMLDKYKGNYKRMIEFYLNEYTGKMKEKKIKQYNLKKYLN